MSARPRLPRVAARLAPSALAWVAAACHDGGSSGGALAGPPGLALAAGGALLGPPDQGPLLAMTGLALASLVSEDLALVAGGVLAASGQISLTQAILAGFVGILGGDVLLYGAGRYLGGSLLRRPAMRWLISEADLERGQRWFSRAGGLGAIVGSRFVPGLRLPTYVAAGALKAPFRQVFGLLSLAAILWVPLLVGASMTAGRQLLPWIERVQSRALPALLGALVVIWLTRKVALPALSWKGRRRLLGRWRRLRRWEYWPMWAFYPPVVAQILLLGLRHRSATLFTLANPALPAGGFIGESKDAIYRALAPSAGAALLAHTLIGAADDPSARAREVMAWMTISGLGFPIALKPDAGQRGQAVRIARTAQDVEDYFRDVRVPVIAQEFASGHEFGVFYASLPGAGPGRIISITQKLPTAIVGDGRRSLGELILLDHRAVCQAALFERVHAARLAEVPAVGERVALVEIGTHRLGAEFRDGSRLHGPALEAAIEAIAGPFHGFHFGRFDLRAPSVEDFRRGANLKIVELNGVTAEATHIYDRRTSVWQAWRVLGAQWRLAFAIGAAHRAAGLEPTGLRGLWRQFTAFQAPE